jgi:hypothetical protein
VGCSAGRLVARPACRPARLLCSCQAAPPPAHHSQPSSPPPTSPSTPPRAGEATEEAETQHRLCPTYASDINSPLRHVRTRVYFTSESHIHSLVNVLR